MAAIISAVLSVGLLTAFIFWPIDDACINDLPLSCWENSDWMWLTGALSPVFLVTSLSLFGLWALLPSLKKLRGVRRAGVLVAWLVPTSAMLLATVPAFYAMLMAVLYPVEYL